MIYAAADLHGYLPEVPRDADLLLLAGDLAPDFRAYGSIDKSGHQQSNWMDTEFRAWLEGHGVETVACWGNHDFLGQAPGAWPRTKPLPNFALLQDQKYEIGGITIWGTPWVPNLPFWAFYGSPQALEARAELIPEGIDVLMTHGPPYRAGDFVPHDGCVGDKSLNAAIERVRPPVTICGHIHEARGYHEVSGSPVLNVSAVDEFYDLHDNPWTALYGL